MATKETTDWTQPVWLNTAHLPTTGTVTTNTGTVIDWGMTSTVPGSVTPPPIELDKYIVSNNVAFRILDILGGYRLQLLVDNLVVWSVDRMGGLLLGDKEVLFPLPIIAAIHEEEVKGVEDDSTSFDSF